MVLKNPAKRGMHAAKYKKAKFKDRDSSITSGGSGEESEGQLIKKLRLPRSNEIFGIVEQRVGGSRMKVKCLDGFTRICRIPGRLKKNLWVREGDIIVVEPWEYSKDDKGDVIYKYTKTQVGWLKNDGYLDKLSAEEF